MKKSKIEKLLKQEINQSAPSNFDAIWDKCGKSENSIKEEIKEPVFVTPNGDIDSSRHKRNRFTAIILAVILAFGGALFALIYNLINGAGFVDEMSGGYFIFDINPSIELSYDEEGKIDEAKGLNKDGEVLLCELNLIGKNYEEVSEIIFDACVKLGYFSADRQNNAVLVSATRDDGSKDEKMTAAIKEYFSGEFVNNKICGVVITGVENPKLQEEADKYSIDVQKYNLIQHYIELGGDLSEDEYSTITIRDLYADIKELEKEVEEKSIKELNEDLQEAEEDLIENMSEQVKKLIEGLKDAIEDLTDGSDDKQKKAYEKQLEVLEYYADEIDESKTTGEFNEYIDKLLYLISELSKIEERPILKQLFEDAYKQIVLLNDNAEKMFKDLEKLKETAEDTYLKRKNKYENSSGEVIGVDIEKWQEEKEKELELSWYDIKKAWDIERDSDFDDD